MCPMQDSLATDSRSNNGPVNRAQAIKLHYMQGSTTISSLDLVEHVQRTGLRKHQVDQWIANRPAACNSINLCFADNIELVLWQHKDWNTDRRRA